MKNKLKKDKSKKNNISNFQKISILNSVSCNNLDNSLNSMKNNNFLKSTSYIKISRNFLILFIFLSIIISSFLFYMKFDNSLHWDESVYIAMSKDLALENSGFTELIRPVFLSSLIAYSYKFLVYVFNFIEFDFDNVYLFVSIGRIISFLFLVLFLFLYMVISYLINAVFLDYNFSKFKEKLSFFNFLHGNKNQFKLDSFLLILGVLISLLSLITNYSFIEYSLNILTEIPAFVFIFLEIIFLYYDYYALSGLFLGVCFAIRYPLGLFLAIIDISIIVLMTLILFKKYFFIDTKFKFKKFMFKEKFKQFLILNLFFLIAVSPVLMYNYSVGKENFSSICQNNHSKMIYFECSFKETLLYTIQPLYYASKAVSSYELNNDYLFYIKELYYNQNFILIGVIGLFFSVFLILKYFKKINQESSYEFYYNNMINYIRSNYKIMELLIILVMSVIIEYFYFNNNPHKEYRYAVSFFFMLSFFIGAFFIYVLRNIILFFNERTISSKELRNLKYNVLNKNNTYYKQDNFYNSANLNFNSENSKLGNSKLRNFKSKINFSFLVNILLLCFMIFLFFNLNFDIFSKDLSEFNLKTDSFNFFNIKNAYSNLYFSSQYLISDFDSAYLRLILDTNKTIVSNTPLISEYTNSKIYPYYNDIDEIAREFSKNEYSILVLSNFGSNLNSDFDKKIGRLINNYEVLYLKNVHDEEWVILSKEPLAGKFNSLKNSTIKSIFDGFLLINGSINYTYIYDFSINKSILDKYYESNVGLSKTPFDKKIIILRYDGAGDFNYNGGLHAKQIIFELIDFFNANKVEMTLGIIPKNFDKVNVADQKILIDKINKYNYIEIAQNGVDFKNKLFVEETDLLDDYESQKAQIRSSKKILESYFNKSIKTFIPAYNNALKNTNLVLKELDYNTISTAKWDDAGNSSKSKNSSNYFQINDLNRLDIDSYMVKDWVYRIYKSKDDLINEIDGLIVLKDYAVMELFIIRDDDFLVLEDLKLVVLNYLNNSNYEFYSIDKFSSFQKCHNLIGFEKIDAGNFELADNKNNFEYYSVFLKFENYNLSTALKPDLLNDLFLKNNMMFCEGITIKANKDIIIKVDENIRQLNIPLYVKNTNSKLDIDVCLDNICSKIFKNSIFKIK